MSSDVFIVSSVRDISSSVAIRQAIELAGISPAQVQDAIFGLDGSSALPDDLASIAHAAGLSCPVAGISPAPRAILFGAASILSDDIDLSLVAVQDSGACVALVLASPEAVGRLNLLPRARIAARSLSGPEPALRMAGLASTDVEIHQDGGQLTLLHDLLDELEARSARWGMVSMDRMVILIERL